MKKLHYLFYIALMIMTMAGCEPLNTVEITIELDEFSYSPNHIELEVGQVVTLTLINLGAIEHEIMFGRNVMTMDGRANGYVEDLFQFSGVEPRGMGDHSGHEHNEDGMDAMDGMGDMEGMAGGDEQPLHSGYMILLDAENSTATIIFEVTEAMLGQWEFGCFLESGSHYSAGMLGTLTVTN